MTVDLNKMTYGAEHELSDWDARQGVPPGFDRADDYTIVNSCGIASHPNLAIFPLGGEFNTPPTETIDEQVHQLRLIKAMHPDVSVNYRSNLHIHVHVPGLKDDLQLLKQFQFFIHTEFMNHVHQMVPIPIGKTLAEKKREKRMHVSHRSFVPMESLRKQFEATTVQEFFEGEVHKGPDGRPLYHLRARCCVNLRQLLDTDTIEFRHFPGTLDEDELRRCIQWCHDFVHVCLAGESLQQLVTEYTQNRKLPFHPFQPFDELLEIGYQATCGHQPKTGGFTKQEILDNITAILGGTFYGHLIEHDGEGSSGTGEEGEGAYQKAVALARGLPRKRVPKPASSSSPSETA